MTTLHTIFDFGTHTGGLATSTYNLVEGLVAAGVAADLLTIDVADPGDTLVGRGEEWIKVLPNDRRTPIAFSRNVKRFLDNNDYDIYHTDGIWQYINHATSAAAHRRNRPFVLSPHGMLYPEALKISAWKKRLASALWFKRDIARATCLHATCPNEVESIRRFGYNGPVAVIPDPVSIPDLSSLGLPPITPNSNMREKASQSLVDGLKSSRLRVGYLGRLHPRKQAENVFYAVHSLGDLARDIEIVIAGSGEPRYEAFLRAEARRLGVNAIFKGFVDNIDKYREMRSFTALFLPSDFENFGMVVPEALACGTPVCATTGSPWEILETNKCGWWRDPSPANLAEVIREIHSTPADELIAMGDRGRRLVADRFHPTVISAQMLALYRHLASPSSNPAPNFLH